MGLWTRIGLLLALSALVWLPLRPILAEPILAEDDGWVRTPQGDVRLIAAVAAVGEEKSLPLGLHFRLKPHWKVYWRSPGDAGYPPALTWTGSENLAKAEIAWPAPARFSLLGIETAGYEDELVLPIAITPEQVGLAVSLKAAVDFLVCNQICVPQHADLALFLPRGEATPTSFAHLINRFAVKVPGAGAASGLRLLSVSSDGTRVRVEVASDTSLHTPDLFIEGPDGLNVGAPVVELRDGGRRAILQAPVTAGSGPKGGLAGASVTLTFVDGERAMEATAPVSVTPHDQGGAAELLAMLGMAILGGLILNLMPCVLPILSLKVMALMGHGGAEHAHARRSFIATAAGILFSFLLLAVGAVMVKAAGEAVGWGIQFQRPSFLITMVTLLTLFAANLWGVFEISLPHRMMGVGAGYGHPHSLGGHFLTGAFATLLATPCSAPFLGTAIGFALARGTGEIVMIFAALGLGMGLPYLLVAAMPSLATRLPRPGRWMVRVKGIMGLLLACTGGWLLTVLATLTDATTALRVGAVMAAVVATLAVRTRLPARIRPLGVVAVALLAASAFVIPERHPPEAVGVVVQDGLWHPFDRATLTREVAKGRLVFVDVTADWCVTCKVNKAAVLERGEVDRRLRSADVLAMRADWTRPSDDIAAYLASFGRYGIPFNAVYGPGAPQGIALPEILTVSAVLEALETAATAPKAR